MWSNKIHERQKFIILKIAHKGLSLEQNVVSRGIHVNDTMCLHGYCHEEDDVHVFFSYQFAKGLWFTSMWDIHWKEHINQDINYYLNQIWSTYILGPMTKQKRENFILYNATIIDHL